RRRPRERPPSSASDSLRRTHSSPPSCSAMSHANSTCSGHARRGTRDRTVWMQVPYLGSSIQNHEPIGGTPEDTVGEVGPPRCGKSSGILVPTLLSWGGPAVATSTKSDLVTSTADRRLELAQQTGGRVWVYDPM